MFYATTTSKKIITEPMNKKTNHLDTDTARMSI